MPFKQDPDIFKGCNNPEGIFQNAIKDEIGMIQEQKKFEAQLVDFLIFEKFGLDLAVFIRMNNSFSIRLFELKAFVGSRQAGVGFGNQRGKGSQVDLLLLEDWQLSIINNFVRWIIVDGTKPKAVERYAIFDNFQAKNAAMGGVSSGKQNNLRVKELMRNSMSWDRLSKEIEYFLLSE